MDQCKPDPASPHNSAMFQRRLYAPTRRRALWCQLKSSTRQHIANDKPSATLSTCLTHTAAPRSKPKQWRLSLSQSVDAEVTFGFISGASGGHCAAHNSTVLFYSITTQPPARPTDHSPAFRQSPGTASAAAVES